MHINHWIARGVAGIVIIAGGCGETRVKSEHTMRLETTPFEATLALEGPIEISMQMPSVTYDGTYISEEQYKWVESGKTTGEWVVAAYGVPDFVTALSDGSEIWRWTFRPTRAEGQMFRLFGKDDEPAPSHISTIVHVRGGIVVDKHRG
jgi:hypothetical protein